MAQQKQKDSGGNGWLIGFLIFGIGGSLLLLGLVVFFFIIMIIAVTGKEEVQAAYGGYCSPTGEVNMEAVTSVMDGAGVFAGHEDDFINAAEKYGLDPILLMAIAMHETGYGTSNLVVNHNNPGGLYNSSAGDFYYFDSLAEGLDAMASNLYDNYYAEGLYSIEDIGAKYAPIGAANDPTNLNANWVPTITGIANDLGGLTMNCEALQLGEFVIPTMGEFTVTSHFGYRIHPIYGTGKFHKGIDLDCQMDDPILAAAPGKVIYVQDGSNSTGWGKYVIIEHGGFQTQYNHLNSTSVGLNQVVQAGEQIGGCGTTGTSTGTHLDFMVTVDGELVDPFMYLTGDGEAV